MKYTLFTIFLISALWISKNPASRETGAIKWKNIYQETIEENSNGKKPSPSLHQEPKAVENWRSYGQFLRISSSQRFER
ncbi:MAG: hypothetical protein MK086_10135 [Flavobacteriales bacterium]|nr:hypothetical protein [Flavobacteriales bacterium]